MKPKRNQDWPDFLARMHNYENSLRNGLSIYSSFNFASIALLTRRYTQTPPSILETTKIRDPKERFYLAQPGDPIYRGVIEYCGIQRSGKDTLMIRDLFEKVIPQAPWRKIYSNTKIDAPNVTYYPSLQLVDRIIQAKHQKETNCIFYFSEASQYLGSRGWNSKIQTEVVTFAWQCPKRNILWLYSDNLGNSVDVQLALASNFLIIPHYRFGQTYEEDFIEYSVTNIQQMTTNRQRQYGLWRYHQKFNSNEPIE